MNLATCFTRITVLRRQNITQVVLQIVLTIRVMASSIFVKPLCGLCGPAAWGALLLFSISVTTASTGPVRSSVVIRLTTSASITLA